MRCYLTAVSLASSIDATTNTLSLFSLVEQVEVSEFPAVVPLELHAGLQLTDSERASGTEFEVSFAMELDGKPTNESAAVTIRPSALHHRIRVSPVQIPSVGAFQVIARWREKGHAEWALGEVRWPLTATLSPGSKTAA